MGFFDKLLGRKPCPKCGHPVGSVSGGKVCLHCDTYLTKSGDALVPMAADFVADRPWFASPLPWPDVRAVQEGVVLELSAATALMRMIGTKDEGVRRLDAQWPQKCCLCGGPAARSETIAQAITIPRFKGALNVGDQKVTLVVPDIPHCGAHSGGVAFGRILSLASTVSIPYGLLFRSLGYRNEFRARNPWKWLLD
jgi:hypothetical protein